MKYLTFMLVACGIASAANAANHVFCSQEIGKDNASVYVNQCIQISPATHPPCNDQNSCAMIKDEIKRGCEFAKKTPGGVVPKFCDDNSQPATLSSPPKAENCEMSAKIPAISNAEYLEARSTLIASGWQPLRVLLSLASDPITSASVSNLVNNGVFETGKCIEKSKECIFIFRDKFSNLLAVTASSDSNHNFHGAQLACFSDQKERDGRASKMANVIVSMNSGYIAQKIQNITHPTGSAPKLSGLSVHKYDDQISVEIDVEWSGGLTNKTYKTSVAWRFNKSAHVSTTIKADTAIFAAAPENVARLNTFFETEVDPLVRHALEE